MKTNLIGVNGKISAGKDTVGRIIQYLCVGADKANISYNDWDGKPVWGTENNKFHKSTWQIKKFAGKVKQTATLLTGVPVKMWEDQEFKKQCMPEEWNYFVSIDFPEMTGEEIKDSDSILVKTTYKRMTYREFLQKLGTEAMRDGLHTNVWVNALFADYTPVKILGNIKPRRGGIKYLVEMPNWIITDMRFPNEMEAVKERGGITIRVVRDVREFKEYFNGKEWVKKPMPNDIHPSETALDDAKFDYEIINDGTIEDLIEKVKEILIKEQIL